MDDANDTIDALLARVGGMLEDASVVALLAERVSTTARITMLQQACREALSLLNRAATLNAEG